MAEHLWLISLGFSIGTLATLIGAGGGFVLVPILLLFYPRENSEIITTISLMVVFLNALSGSVAYARMGRIDYKSGSLFSAATIPGAILGALILAYIPRRAFEGIFGLLMIMASVFLSLRPNRTRDAKTRATPPRFSRRLVEADGTVHIFSYNRMLALGASFAVGFFSSFLGIGGGIFQVPILTQLLNFPIYIATATSQFILAIMALTGTLVHIATGTFHRVVERTIFLAAGVLAGAPLGARLSARVRGDWIMRGLAIALGFVGLHILMVTLNWSLDKAMPSAD